VTRVRRRLLASVVLATALVGACSGDDAGSSAPPSTEVTTSTTVARQGAYAVGRRSVEVVDPSRPTAADPRRDRDERPDRTMPVLLLYPAQGSPTNPATPIDDATPAEGSFPLIVFSHGVTADGPRYEGRLKQWARAGYVVAAPTFPLSSGRGGLIRDYVNQPADVSFVLDELLSLPDEDPLAGHIDPDRLAAAGHSLGAITTIGVGLTSCCSDPRLDAIVSLSGTRLPFEGEAVDQIDRLPFLAVHGAKDPIIPVSGSDSLFEDATGPAAYLRLEDAGHTDYLRTDAALVDATVLGFLALELHGDEHALDAIPTLVAERGDATFEVKRGS
jgi:predicted dienelactone hydrolase